MNTLIDKFKITLSENNGSIMVNYRYDTLSGYCEYRLVEVNNTNLIERTKKRFKQKGWILINTDMGDIIEYIHSNSPLNSEDFFNVDKLIRDHSLSRVRDLYR